MINVYRADSADGSLEFAHTDVSTIYEDVMANGVAVIKNAFSPERIDVIRSRVYRWGSETDITPPQTYVDRNFHSVESGISPRQKTSHCYHAYNFNRISDLEDDMRTKLEELFIPMSIFLNRLTGENGTFTQDQTGARQHPQIIQYPKGGGHFGRHTHPLKPQHVGLILGLSARGRDFGSGATHFEHNDAIIRTDEVHDIGDLVLFRYDIPHWITSIDQECRLDLESNSGRWTAVLPYY